MIEFQSLISLFDGFNSTVKFVENCKRVAAIIRGEPDKIDVALQHLENINNKLEVVRLSEHIVQVPSIQSVRDITQTRQRQIELTEVRESLDPLQRALNSDLLASAMILTPDKMRHAMGKNPWEVLEDISPVNLARPHYAPNKVPIIFEHQSIRYLGWLKRGLLPVVFDCQFEDLLFNVPQRPEIITPTRTISSSNNEEQQQLKAKIREEKANQYLLNQYFLKRGELSAWNPLDWWRLLIWALWSPAYLKVHREKFGQESEKYVGSWLVSTLTWLPLFLAILAPALALISLSLKPSVVQNAIAVVTIAWFLAGIFGYIEHYGASVAALFVAFLAAFFIGFLIMSSVASVVAVGVAFFVAVVVAGGVAVGVAGSVAVGATGGVAMIVIMVVVVVGVAFFAVGGVALFVELVAVFFFNKSLETGKPSYFNRFLLILLIASYVFLIWYFYLKGWQYFK